MRLTEIDRAERKLIRQRLDGLTTRELRELAKAKSIDLRGANTHLCIVNTMMNSYEMWKEKKK